MDTLKTMTDEMLVNLYATGNNRAFEVLLLRHKNKVYSYIFNLVRDRDLCEDIFQETFIRVVTCIRGKVIPNQVSFWRGLPVLPII